MVPPPTTTTRRRRTTLSSPWSVGCAADKKSSNWWILYLPCRKERGRLSSLPFEGMAGGRLLLYNGRGGWGSRGGGWFIYPLPVAIAWFWGTGCVQRGGKTRRPILVVVIAYHTAEAGLHASGQPVKEAYILFLPYAYNLGTYCTFNALPLSNGHILFCHICLRKINNFIPLLGSPSGPWRSSERWRGRGSCSGILKT